MRIERGGGSAHVIIGVFRSCGQKAAIVLTRLLVLWLDVINEAVHHRDQR